MHFWLFDILTNSFLFDKRLFSNTGKLGFLIHLPTSIPIDFIWRREVLDPCVLSPESELAVQDALQKVCLHIDLIPVLDHFDLAENRVNPPVADKQD